MHIQDILASGKTTLSFEFFPPKTADGTEALLATARRLAECRPAFVSVTYGAGGSTRELTRGLVERLKQETGLVPIPHLTSVGHKKAEVQEMLESYARMGVENVLALRGDPPKGGASAAGEFPYAKDLVEFVREFRESSGAPRARRFGIGVAGFPEGHPSTPNRLAELDHLKAKVDAGADYICTQLFFDNHDFFDFRERCEMAGIKTPIIAGIFPILGNTNLRRMADLAGGSRFPARLLRAVEQAGNDPSVLARIGTDYAVAQCDELVRHGVAGLHLYTMNQASAAEAICQALRGRI